MITALRYMALYTNQRMEDTMEVEGITTTVDTTTKGMDTTRVNITLNITKAIMVMNI